MEKLWQFLMQANAKALFVIALVILIAISGWRGWVEFTALRHPALEGETTGRAQFKPGKELGLIAFASNQLAWAGTPPQSPFFPTLDALATNPAAAIAAWRARTGRDGPVATGTNDANKDPFKHLRVNRAGPGGAGERPGPPPDVARLTYKGFFKGPDGKASALFHDSSTEAAMFKHAGDDMHGATLLDANIRHAKIRLAAGDEVDLALNDSIDLKPEPATP